MMLFVGALMAEVAKSPVALYLQKPEMDSFARAVSYLLEESGKNEEKSLQYQLNLAYIANYEAMRILDQLSEKIDELGNGEKFSLANIYLGMDKYEQAIKIYDKLNETSPKWSCPWRHKGEAYYKMGDFQAVAKALEQAIETNKEHYDAYIWMGLTLYEMQDYKRALEQFEIAKKLNAEEEDSHFDETIPDEKLEQIYLDLLEKTKK